MSSLDLSRIVESLQSPKVKSRNDALSLLNDFQVSKLRLSAVQLASLISALLRAIEIERDALCKQKNGTKSGNSASLSRASGASAFLRDLVLESLRKPASSKSRPRLKTCVSLVSSILALYHEPSSIQPFDSCSGNFAETLSALFGTPFVFTHLPPDSWSKNIHFLIEAIAYELEYVDMRGPNENLINHLYSALFHLIGGSSNFGIVSLTQDKRYFPLLHLLKKTLATFNKRESPVLVVAFEIINNLLISLSTEDVGFVHQLICIGLDAALFFATTSVTAMSDQISIFLNLDPFHRYLALAKIPKLVSVQTSDTPHDSVLVEDSPLIIYNVKMLIGLLIQRLMSVSQGLSSENVGLCDEITSTDWFHLRHIYMKSPGARPIWLLATATARLIASYYRIRGNSTSPGIFESTSNESKDTFTSKSFSTNSFKRQKLVTKGYDLNGASSPAEFLNTLINSEDIKAQMCGLQLLAFCCQFEDSSFSGVSEHGEVSGNSDHDDSTVLDINLSIIENPQWSPITVVSSCIKLVSDRRHPFWALLVCRGILSESHILSSTDSAVLETKLHQLLKISLDLVKETPTCQIACTVFGKLVQSCSSFNLTNALDPTLSNQLENVINLSDILGPASINLPAVIFWQAIAKICDVLGSRKKPTLAQDIAKWLTVKWRAISGHTSLTILEEYSRAIVQVLTWLDGPQVCPAMSYEESTTCDVYEQGTKYREKLSRFITMESNFERSYTLSNQVNVSLENPSGAAVSIIRALCEHPSDIAVEDNFTDAVSLSMAYVRFLGVVKLHLPEHSSELEEKVHLLMSSLSPEIQSREQAMLLVSSTLRFNLSKTNLGEAAFPMEVIQYYFMENDRNGSKSSEFRDDEVLTDDDLPEFSLRSETPEASSTDNFNYFKFNLKYGSFSSGKAATLYPQALEAKHTNDCVSYYLSSDSLETESEASISLAESIVRLVGEKLVAVQDYDRLDTTTITSCILLEKLFPLMESSSAKDLRKDTLDLVAYYFQCVQKGVFISDQAISRIWTMLLKFTRFNAEQSISNSDILSVFLDHLPGFSNNTFTNVSESLHSYACGLGSAAQFRFVNEVIGLISVPQSSAESSASFCLFLETFTRGLDLDHLVLGVLAKFSRFPAFAAYSTQTIETQARNHGFQDSPSYFRSMRVELLASWWINSQSLLDYPYQIFRYSKKSDFIGDNARHIIAVTFSTRCKPNQAKIRQTFVNTIVDLKATSLSSLTCDCVPLMVALSYSKSGIRNEVFAHLKSIIQQRYEKCITDMLPLIILEIIMMTDMSSEVALKAAIGSQHTGNYLISTETTKSSHRISIDPSSSVELISMILEKFQRGGAENFWSSRTVYFLARRVGLNTGTENSVAWKLTLRRLQYIFCLSRKEVNDPHLVSLMFSICLPIIRSGEAAETMPILDQITFEECMFGPIDCFLPMILDLLASTIMLEEPERVLFRDVYSKIKTCITTGGGSFESLEALIVSAINYATGQEITITFSGVENFLSDTRIAQRLSIAKHDILKILSKVLPLATQEPDAKRSSILAQFFLEQDFAPAVGDDFQLWISEYLAEFYLNGQANLCLEDFVSQQEHSGVTKENMANSCKFLDAIISYLMRELKSGSYEKQAYFEIVLGGISSYFESNIREMSKFFDFDEIHNQIHPYVTPLSPNLLPLLSGSDSFFVSTSMYSFSAEFEKTFVKLPFADWSTQLLCSLIQEFLGPTTIAKILVDCTSQLPDLAKHVLPSFVCYYLHNTKKNAAENILKIFAGFWKNFKKPICQDATNLMRDIAVCIRIGAMQNMESFVQLYKAMNHEHLFAMVNESNSPKTALLFFEDSLEKVSQKLDWAKFRSPISDLYASLNDEDSLAGIPGDLSIEGTFTLRHSFVQSEEKLRYNTGFFNADLILGKTPSPAQIIGSLFDEGFIGASDQLNQSSRVSSSSQWSWQLGHWEPPANTTSSEKHDVTYAYFKQIRDSPLKMDKIYASSMLKLSSGMFVKSRGEHSPRSILTETESWLEGFAIIRSANDVSKLVPSDFADHVQSFNRKTDWFLASGTHSYENILLARRLAFTLHSSSQERARMQNSLTTENLKNQQLCLQGEIGEIVRYNNLSRHEGMLQKTINSSILLEKTVHSESGHGHLQDMLHRLSSHQAAHMLWLEGKMDLSVSLLAKLAEEGDIVFELYALNVSKEIINAQLAVWLAESRSDLGSNILHGVVEPIVEEISSVKDMAQQSKIYHLLASFCESQFKSPIFKEQLVQLDSRVKAKQDEVLELKTHYGRSGASASERNAARHYYEDLKNQIRAESEELLNLKKLRVDFVHNAVMFYLKALGTGIASDEDLDKFFSLFLEFSGDETLQLDIADDLSCLPSTKPLIWCTQILSRVSQEPSAFQDNIQQLLFRVCHDHPFHSLYYLTSLLFHDKLAKETANGAMLSRVKASTQIRNKLLTVGSEYVSNYLTPIEKMCMESVSLAEVKSTKGKTLHLDKLKMGHFWMNELPSIPPPTLQIEVSDSGYANVPAMFAINPRIVIAATGISLPKVVTFTLSDGKTHKMLMKHGADDLRQDAIMEQVFAKMNKIFRKDKQTRKRKLRVRTYNAVPLGPKAGVIEFVPDSKSLFEVIQPLHQIKDSMKLEKAREMMKAGQTNSHEERLRTYRNIEEKIRPVLKQYFMANFVTPDDWFSSRQIYIRGIATSSMVGHILGLGDRHCNNILLDQFTGEPIHIDLGVAFDQGKRLKVPETVPFRLTRDVVDAFGYMGTAGSFTKVGEHTLRVLRASRDHILSMLDVLRWDPLYSWSISPIKKRKLQEENGGAFNSEAKQDGSAAGKAILGVSEKLSAGGLSVEAAVRELIREARSEQNLAVIYCGWCPFY